MTVPLCSGTVPFVEHPTYPPTPGDVLRAARAAAGVSQDAVAAHIPTTRQALGRWERNPRLPYVKAQRYRAALDAAVAESVGA